MYLNLPIFFLAGNFFPLSFESLNYYFIKFFHFQILLVKPIYQHDKNNMQNGFTQKKSLNNALLIISLRKQN